MLANGSEVSILTDAAKIIENRTHYRVRVVSAPSEGIFREQTKHYQQSVIPDGIPVFGLTAGLPTTLEGMIRDNGKVFGMTHFGYSAPYTVLDEKFGFTAEQVIKEIMELIKENN